MSALRVKTPKWLSSNMALARPGFQSPLSFYNLYTKLYTALIAKLLQLPTEFFQPMSWIICAHGMRAFEDFRMGRDPRIRLLGGGEMVPKKLTEFPRPTLERADQG